MFAADQGHHHGNRLWLWFKHDCGFRYDGKSTAFVSIQICRLKKLKISLFLSACDAAVETPERKQNLNLTDRRTGAIEHGGKMCHIVTAHTHAHTPRLLSAAGLNSVSLSSLNSPKILLLSPKSRPLCQLADLTPPTQMLLTCKRPICEF